MESVASSYVSLKRRGRNLVGLCPFHGEKTPSFTVYPETASFYCFGCGAGGDVITFIKKIENLDYLDAVRFLADRAGLKMPENDVNDATSRLRTRILEANREAAASFTAGCMRPRGALPSSITTAAATPITPSGILGSVMRLTAFRRCGTPCGKRASKMRS